MSIPKIKTVEITYAIYQGLSMRRLCEEYVGGKVNNAPGFNLRRNFVLACTPSLSLKVITWLEPTIQSKTLYLVSGQLNKTRDLDKLLTWARDMVTWYWSADALFWQLSINYNMDVQYQRCTYGYGNTTLIFQGIGLSVRTYVRTNVRTNSHVRTKLCEIDGLLNFLRYGAPLVRLRRAGAPLKRNLALSWRSWR